MSASSAEHVPRLTWSTVSRLIRLTSQTGTWLLMLPTLWALVLSAKGLPPLRLLVIFMWGSFLMRSAGVILNDAPPDLAYPVLRDGLVLLERDRAARLQFEVRTRNRYFDLVPFLTRYRRRALERAVAAP